MPAKLKPLGPFKTWVVFLLSLLSGVLGVFMYPSQFGGTAPLPDMGTLAWFAYLPLLLALGHARFRSRFLFSLFSAFIFYIGSLYWLATAMTSFGGLAVLPATGVLVLIALILAFFFALAVSGAFFLAEKSGWPFFLCFAALAVLADWLRTYIPVGGCPWPMPAYSQGHYLAFFQWVDVTGMWGLTFLVYLINGLLAEVGWALFDLRHVDRLIRRGVALVLIVLLSFYASVYRQRKAEEAMVPVAKLSIALIQGNIAQDLKWNPKKATENFRTFLEMSKEAKEGETIDLVVWPETAFPFTIDLTQPRTRLWEPEKVGAPVIMGAVSSETIDSQADPLIYNSAVLVSENGQWDAVYHKRHLVPFGEYIPMKEWLVFAKRLTTSVGDFTPGRDPILLPARGVRFGPLICYEDIFPDMARQSTEAGADALLVLANDAWYGASSALAQHLVFSQFRALENRRALLRSTNNGMTAMIDPFGQIVKNIPPFRKGILIERLPLEKADSFYTRHGDWFNFMLCGLVVLMASTAAWKKRRSTCPRN